MLNLPLSPRRRRPSLTPMIDVVFLLLVFFMLVARFGGAEGISLLLAPPEAATQYTGPQRLVTVLPETVTLNGQPAPDLPGALSALMTSPEDVVVVRPGSGTDVARLLEVLGGLQAAGLTRLTVVE
jgi:biopolymer transport protein ExbD